MSDDLKNEAKPNKAAQRSQALSHEGGQRWVCGSTGRNLDDVVEAIGLADFEVAGALETSEREKFGLFGCDKE